MKLLTAPSAEPQPMVAVVAVPGPAAAAAAAALPPVHKLVEVDSTALEWLCNTSEGQTASATSLRIRFKMGWNHAKRLHASAQAHPGDVTAALEMVKTFTTSAASAAAAAAAAKSRCR